MSNIGITPGLLAPIFSTVSIVSRHSVVQVVYCRRKRKGYRPCDFKKGGDRASVGWLVSGDYLKGAPLSIPGVVTERVSDFYTHKADTSTKVVSRGNGRDHEVQQHKIQRETQECHGP